MPVFMWTTHPSAHSRISKPARASHTQISRPWECMAVCGTEAPGRRKAGVWKSTGTMLLLLPRTQAGPWMDALWAEAARCRLARAARMLPRVRTTRQSTRARLIAWTGWRTIAFITITATTQHAIQPNRWNAITTLCRSLIRFMSKTDLRSTKLSAYCRWQTCLYFIRCFGCTPNHKNWRISSNHISQIYWFIDLVGLKTAMSILDSQTHLLFWA